MKRVLFVAYGGGHITMVAPVVRQLEARGVECVVLALTTGYRKAVQLGLRPLAYRDFVHLVEDLDEALAWGGKLEAGNRHPAVDPQESRLYLGVNYLQWVDELGPDAAAARYAQHGRRGFYPLRFMRRVLEELSPDAVVATNSPRSEEAALHAAQEMGIPTLSMTDLPLRPGDPFCQRPRHAGRVTVLSSDACDVLASVGVPRERIVVAGNPAFDALAHEDVYASGRSFRAALGWSKRKVVMFAGHEESRPATPPEWQGTLFGQQVEQHLRDWVAADNAKRGAIIRYHPSDSHLYPAGPPQAGVHRSEPERETLHQVLLAADILVVQTSTVGLEGALAGLPVLCLMFAPSVRDASYNYAGLGLATPVGSFGELRSILDRKELPPAAHSERYPVGSAARTIADEIVALV